MVTFMKSYCHDFSNSKAAKKYSIRLSYKTSESDVVPLLSIPDPYLKRITSCVQKLL
jgi:hypothetical protein